MLILRCFESFHTELSDKDCMNSPCCIDYLGKNAQNVEIIELHSIVLFLILVIAHGNEEPFAYPSTSSSHVMAC